MSTTDTSAPPTGIVDMAARSADQMIRTTQRVANGALDSMAGTVEQIRQDTAPVVDHATQQVTQLAQAGVDGALDASRRARDAAMRASDVSIAFIRDEPVKSMFIAAAAGAALMALFTRMGRVHRHD